MGINKNFVVKNGFEVSTDLILANADTRRVGIASTNPQYTLDVAGGIGATDFYLTGIGTFVDELNVGLDGTVLTALGIGGSVGIGTALPAYLLDIRSPVLEGQTALYVQGDVEITGNIRADDIIFDDAEIQDLTVTDTLFVVGLSTFNSNVVINTALNVSGITTLSSYVDINDSLDVAVDLNVVGLTTLGGYVDINDSVDISTDLNVGGITTLGGYVDINDSVDISTDLNVGGLTTLGGYVDINDSVDISTDLNVVGLTTLATVNINAGEIDVTRIETGDLNVTGIATIATLSAVDAELSNLNVTGIATLGSVEINSGIITAKSGIITYFGDGSGLINTPPGNPAGSNTGVQYNNNGAFAGSSNFTFDGDNVNISGIVTAAAFVGNGSNLTGIVTASRFQSTIAPGDSPIIVASNTLVTNLNADLLDGYNSSLTDVVNTVVVRNSSGFIVGNLQGNSTTSTTATNVVGTSDRVLFNNGTNTTTTSANLTFDGTNLVCGGTVTASSDEKLKDNIQTIENALEKVLSLRGVEYDRKDSGEHQIGVIAQEVERIIPEVVYGDETKSVAYGNLVGVLIEAIKEQQLQIDKLKKNTL